MNQTDTQNPDEFVDLGFDLEPHREALISFANLNLAPIAVKPALRAREMAFVRFPSSTLTLRVTDNLAGQEAVIYQAENAEEAQKVRAEVERYFLRHFPGRTLAQTEEEMRPGEYVCMVCSIPDH